MTAIPLISYLPIELGIEFDVFDPLRWDEIPVVEINGQIFYDTQPIWIFESYYPFPRTSLAFIDALNGSIFDQSGERDYYGLDARDFLIRPVEKFESWMLDQHRNLKKETR